MMNEATKQITDMDSFLDWAWQCYITLMRKHKGLHRDRVVLTAHVGLEMRLLQSFHADYMQSRIWVTPKNEIKIFGIRVEFHKNYDEYTCSVGVPDWKPGFDLNGKPNEKPETFTANIESLINNTKTPQP